MNEQLLNPAWNQLVTFYGDLNPQLAHIYARLPGDRNTCRLQGRVEGPVSKLTRTLPCQVPLSDLGPGDSLLAVARTHHRPAYAGSAQEPVVDAGKSLPVDGRQ
jgi:hypothetical protein